MPGPMPPQAAPQGAPSGGPPSGAPQAPGGAPAGGQSPAAQVVSQIHSGLMQLSKMMDQAKGAVSPQDKQQLVTIISAFQALIADMSKGPGQGAPPPKAPGGPRPMNANAKAQPMQ